MEQAENVYKYKLSNLLQISPFALLKAFMKYTRMKIWKDFAGTFGRFT